MYIHVYLHFSIFMIIAINYHMIIFVNSIKKKKLACAWIPCIDSKINCYILYRSWDRIVKWSRPSGDPNATVVYDSIGWSLGWELPFYAPINSHPLSEENNENDMVYWMVSKFVLLVDCVTKIKMSVSR